MRSYDIKRDEAVDRIYSAVAYAINAGMTPKQFISELESAWAEVLDEMKKEAKRDFKNA